MESTLWNNSQAPKRLLRNIYQKKKLEKQYIPYYRIKQTQTLTSLTSNPCIIPKWEWINEMKKSIHNNLSEKDKDYLEKENNSMTSRLNAKKSVNKSTQRYNEKISIKSVNPMMRYSQHRKRERNKRYCHYIQKSQSNPLDYQQLCDLLKEKLGVKTQNHDTDENFIDGITNQEQKINPQQWQSHYNIFPQYSCNQNAKDTKGKFNQKELDPNWKNYKNKSRASYNSYKISDTSSKKSQFSQRRILLSTKNMQNDRDARYTKYELSTPSEFKQRQIQTSTLHKCLPNYMRNKQNKIHKHCNFGKTLKNKVKNNNNNSNSNNEQLRSWVVTQSLDATNIEIIVNKC